MSPKKIGKVYGDKTFTWHSRIKGKNKKLASRATRRRLNREVHNRSH